MPYPRRLLHDDEEVLFELRPHPVRLFAPLALAIALVGGSGFGFVAWSSAPTAFGIALAVVVAGALGNLGARVVGWRATLFVLTTSRVVYRSGVLRRVGREIPLDRIQDVTYVQHLGQRLIGTGSVVVESAGDRGAEAIPDVRRPEWVQREINGAIEGSHRPSARAVAPVPYADPPTASDPAPPRPRPFFYDQGEDATERELEALSDLHRRGVLTDTEYAEKRAEVLGRR